MPDARRLFGDDGERLAERALLARGWRILERNARTRYGEIDVVCHDGRGFVFVEVKTRRARSFLPAIEAVGPRKVDRLTHLAEAWLALRRRRGASWRLAVAAVTVGSDGNDIRIIDVVE